MATITRDDVEALDQEIQRVTDESVTLTSEAENLVQKARDDGKDPLGDAEVFAEIDGAYRKADEVREQLSQLEARKARALEFIASGDRGAKTRRDRAEHTARRANRYAEMASRVFESDQYERLVTSGLLKNKSAQFQLDPVEVAAREEMLEQFFIAAVVDGGPLVPEDQRIIPPVGIPQREVRVIDLLTRGTTDSDTVEWSEQILRTNAAGGVPFGTALPESAYEWVRRTEQVRRRGARVTATRGNLADQGQFMTILRGLLDEDVRLELEDQVVNGDGDGENFEGVFNRSGINSVTRGEEDAEESRIDALHRGLTAHRIVRHRDPTALLIHPTPHSQTVTAKGSDGHYLFVNPTQSDRVSIWGLPAVVSTVSPTETAMWGTWSDATLWVREGISVQAFNQHEDYAAKGLVLVTAEHRAAFKATQARGFTEVGLTDPAPA